ncbi:MAG: hypothetical protein KAV87_12195, partial [Desulfobacteraceae bacterium]|nr:hypothetical protein [Desulfobacteraceae bacterium]
MKDKVLNCSKFFLLAVIFILGSSWSVRAVEQRQPLTVNSAVEIALANNLNLLLQRQEVDRNKGALFSEQGEFDTILGVELEAKEQKISPVVVGSSEREEFSDWNLSLTKKITSGTEFNLSWQNNRFETDSSFALINPSYYSGVVLSLRQPLLKGRGVKMQTTVLRASRQLMQAETFMVDSQAADLAAEVK